MSEELLPCPFCGGEVFEVIPSWNIANAECKECGATWGHCGSRFEGRYAKWNTRPEEVKPNMIPGCKYDTEHKP